MVSSDGFRNGRRGRARSASPLLEVRALSKRYETRTVLERVSFTLGRGEIVSLVGPSGCGKSTLLRVLAGLDRDFDGELLLDGAGADAVPRRASA